MEESGSSTSQEFEEDPLTDKQDAVITETSNDRRLIKGKRLK